MTNKPTFDDVIETSGFKYLKHIASKIPDIKMNVA